MHLTLLATIAFTLTASAPQGFGKERPAVKQTSFIPQTGVGRLIADHLDITTFRASLGPRRSPGMRHFADLGMKPTMVAEGKVEFDSEDWFYAIAVLERADKNGDGIEDIVVQIDDRAKKGTYSTSNKLLLTRFSDSGDLIAIAFEP